MALENKDANANTVEKWGIEIEMDYNLLQIGSFPNN